MLSHLSVIIINITMIIFIYQQIRFVISPTFSFSHNHHHLSVHLFVLSHNRFLPFTLLVRPYTIRKLLEQQEVERQQELITRKSREEIMNKSCQFGDCSEVALVQCSKCTKAFYCSRHHQAQHWRYHQSLCKQVQRVYRSIVHHHIVLARTISYVIRIYCPHKLPSELPLF